MTFRISEQLLWTVVLAAAGVEGTLVPNKTEEVLVQKIRKLQQQMDDWNATQEKVAPLLSDERRLNVPYQTSVLNKMVDLMVDNRRKIKALIENQDSVFFTIATSLVLFVLAGFALIEAGQATAKNVQSVLMKYLLIICFGTFWWWAVGWNFAFGLDEGTDNHGFWNGQQAFGMGFSSFDDGVFSPTGAMKQWVLQWSFCLVSTGIVSGCVSERMEISTFLIYACFNSAWIYPIAVHWTWGNGFLSGGNRGWNINNVGYVDFAGAAPIHIVGGVAAVIATSVAGPRFGSFSGSKQALPHSVPLIAFGTLILWVGFIGLNISAAASSMVTAKGIDRDAKFAMAAQVAMNTVISASTSGLVVLLVDLYRTGKFCMQQISNSIIAGVVSVSACCGNIDGGSAALAGIIGAFFFGISKAILGRILIEDPMGKFSTHAVCGAWSLMAAVLFDRGPAISEFDGMQAWTCYKDSDAGNPCDQDAFERSILANTMLLVFVVGWSAAHALFIFVPLRFISLIRPNVNVEWKGLDSKYYPEKAYDMGVPIVSMQ